MAIKLSYRAAYPRLVLPIRNRILLQARCHAGSVTAVNRDGLFIAFRELLSRILEAAARNGTVAVSVQNGKHPNGGAYEDFNISGCDRDGNDRGRVQLSGRRRRLYYR